MRNFYHHFHSRRGCGARAALEPAERRPLEDQRPHPAPPTGLLAAGGRAQSLDPGGPVGSSRGTATIVPACSGPQATAPWPLPRASVGGRGPGLKPHAVCVISVRKFCLWR